MFVLSSWKQAALGACVLIVCATAGAAGAALQPAPEALELSALTGPEGADLSIGAPAGSAAFEHVHIQIRAPAGSTEPANRIINLEDVAAREGLATIQLGEVGRGAEVSVEAHVREQSPPRIVIYRGEAVVKLRPDLAVTAVYAPPWTLSTEEIDVVADVAELNLETGADAVVELKLGPTPVAEPQQVTVPAGGTLSIAFKSVQLTTPISAELTVLVRDAAPFETAEDNNTGTTEVEVTEHELVRSDVLFPSLAGYGAQFNHHLYAPITAARMPNGGYPDVEQKVKELEPQIVRIFYNDNWEENWDGRHPEFLENYASFVKVVELAQATGATINITYQTLANITRTDSRRRTPEAAMARFADALEDLVKNHGLTNVRWATVGNEPNSGAVTLAQYDALYRALHAQLVARGLRDQIHLMGGDLVELANNPARNHYVWMKWIAANMGDVVDAFSEHVYWNYNDVGRLEYRLRDTAHLMTEEIPPEQRKPVYMMEFGVRGLGACGTRPAALNTYYAVDPTCPEIYRTNIGAFQQFWFAVGAAQLGVAGAAKWDAYWAVYDLTLSPPQVYWMAGPASEGYPLMPSYHAMSLLFDVAVPGWQIIRVGPWDSSDSTVPTYGIEGHGSNDEPEKELVGYAGPNGELTMVGLDTHGRALNTASTDPPARYSIGGLPPNTELNLALWNEAGDGQNSFAGTIQTGPAGVARFEVPLHAAFALTTIPVS